jgi:hypothetical protein
MRVTPTRIALAALATAATVGAAPAAAAVPTRPAPPVVVAIDTTTAPPLQVDANRNGFGDAGDYQVLEGTLEIVGGGSGSYSGRILFLGGGRQGFHVRASLPGGDVFVSGITAFEQGPPLLHLSGLTGGYRAAEGTLQVIPGNNAPTMLVFTLSRRFPLG